MSSHTDRLKTRIFDLEAEQVRLTGVRSGVVARHIRGDSRAPADNATIERDLQRVADDLTLDREALDGIRSEASGAVRTKRRAEAREKKGKVSKLLEQRASLAAKVDKAIDDLTVAMNAYVGHTAAARGQLKEALQLAIPDTQERMDRTMHLYHLLNDTAGLLPVAGASALREIFSALDSPQHIFSFAPGLQLPVGERLTFVEAADWQAYRAELFLNSIEHACREEEALFEQAPAVPQ